MQYVIRSSILNQKRLLAFIIVLISLLTIQSCATKTTLDRPQVKERRHSKKVLKTSTVKGKRQQILSSAKHYIGSKYLYGGRDRMGFDCSGLIRKIFFENKIDIRGNSRTLSQLGKPKTINNALIGDLVFFKKGNSVNHVALIAEVNQNELWVIHSTSSRGVIRENIFASTYWNSKEYFIKDLL